MLSLNPVMLLPPVIALILTIIFFFYYKKAKNKLALYIVIGTVAGVRLGPVLFYQPGYSLSHPLEIVLPLQGMPWTENFRFTGYQGLASHGAAIGISKANQVPFEKYLPLDMGQLLSIPFIFAEILLIFFKRREVLRIKLRKEKIC